MRFNLYRNGVQVLHDVTFNHAVGALYRSQGSEPVPVGRFKIERELRAGGCSHPAFQGLYAISAQSNIEATSVKGSTWKPAWQHEDEAIGRYFAANPTISGPEPTRGSTK